MNMTSIHRITESPDHEGFLGEGHTAKAIIDGKNYAQTDPFILLMDDRLRLPGGEPVGGAHPHAGFETVTFVIQGDDSNWKTGTVEIMTAGKGIVHFDDITKETNMHILQLWLALPPDKRWIEPRLQKIDIENVPTLIHANSEIRVYSGSSNGLTSPVQNYTPFTLVDFNMGASSQISHTHPPKQNGFIYVIEGSVNVVDSIITEGQTGWFTISDYRSESQTTFKTTEQKARFILYTAQPHGVPVIQHGPFVGDTPSDISRLFKEYRSNLMPHLSELPDHRIMSY